MGLGDIPDKYRPKTRRRGRGRVVPPTGPYKAESSTKSIRSKSTRAERRGLESGGGRTAKRVSRLEQHEVERLVDGHPEHRGG